MLSQQTVLEPTPVKSVLEPTQVKYACSRTNTSKNCFRTNALGPTETIYCCCLAGLECLQLPCRCTKSLRRGLCHHSGGYRRPPFSAVPPVPINFRDDSARHHRLSLIMLRGLVVTTNDDDDMVSLFTAVSLACAYPGKGGQAKFISVDKGNTPWIRSGPIPGHRWSPIPVLTGPDRRTANKLIYQCVAIKSNGHQFSYKYKLCWCAQIYTIRAPHYSRLSVASGNRRRLWSKKLSSLFVVDYTTAD